MNCFRRRVTYSIKTAFTILNVESSHWSYNASVLGVLLSSKFMSGNTQWQRRVSDQDLNCTWSAADSLSVLSFRTPNESLVDSHSLILTGNSFDRSSGD